MIPISNLHPLEVKALRVDSSAFSVSVLVKELSYSEGQANQAISRLSAHGLIEETKRTARVSYERTPQGADFAASGSVESGILAALKDGAREISSLRAVLPQGQELVGPAFGRLVKLKAVVVDGDGRARLGAAEDRAKGALVDELLKRAEEEALDEALLDERDREVMKLICRKRGASGALFRVVESAEVNYSLTASGKEMRCALEEAGVTGEEISAITPELLRDGQWKQRSFRAYDADMPPVRVLLGRANPYCQYLREVKDKLVSLGFEEFDGPLVETEFWNSDALFMPQFHSARDVHDVYSIREPTYAQDIEKPYFESVARTHEDGGDTGSYGWNYRFDRDFAKRLILRSQGTVLSAKMLPRARVPGKYFGVVRCFRHDQVDATHLSDFYQVEGIVLGEEVTLRTLLGMLSIFAKELAGAEQVKYVPGYFPFTEPSVEVHIKHPEIGWFELGGSGIFRPEVTKPLGVDVPVLAWGLGIDRMALLRLGLRDLRDLFSYDIDTVRLRRRSHAEN